VSGLRSAPKLMAMKSLMHKNGFNLKVKSFSTRGFAGDELLSAAK
jgi:hypothetical protein